MRHQKGFAFLVELLVALSIAAIIATAALPNLSARMARHELSQVLADLHGPMADIAQMLNCSPSQTNGGMTLSQLPHYTYSLASNPCGSTAPYQNAGPWGSYVSKLTFDGVSLKAVIGTNGVPALRGGTLTVTNAAATGAPKWICNFSNPAFTPYICQ